LVFGVWYGWLVNVGKVWVLLKRVVHKKTKMPPWCRYLYRLLFCTITCPLIERQNYPSFILQLHKLVLQKTMGSYLLKICGYEKMHSYSMSLRRYSLLPSRIIRKKKSLFLVANYKQKQFTFIIFKIYFYLFS
jgi:hypothetical protein